MVNVKIDSFKSMILQGEDKDIRINEGDTVEFVVDNTGEKKVGTITKIAGSKKERKLQLMPVLGSCEELWSVFAIADNSLVVTKSMNDIVVEDEDEDEDDMEDNE